MLLDLLVTLVIGIASFLINLIPDISLDSGFWVSFEQVAIVMDGVSHVIPVGTFLACLSVFVVLHNVTMIIAIINWVIRKIPTIN